MTMTRTPAEKDSLEAALLGESVVDGSRLHCRTKEEVDQLLKVNEFQLSNPRDHAALMGIHSEAIDYLRNQLRLELPPKLLKPTTVEEFFFAASDLQDEKMQRSACALLKIMNVIHLLNGRELLYNLPISQRDLFGLVEDKMERELSVLSRNGIRCQGGRKQKESLMTRMLSKRDSIGIPTHDRLRFQIVTPNKERIAEVILHLFKKVLPVNYVIPHQSVNRLIDIRQLIPWKRYASHALSGKLKALHRRLAAALPYAAPDREYSGRSYRLVKYRVAVPVRLDRYLLNSRHPLESLGYITHVPVEIRILDQETERLNNQGENSYPLYKEKQRAWVGKRVIRGG